MSMATNGKSDIAAVTPVVSSSNNGDDAVDQAPVRTPDAEVIGALVSKATQALLAYADFTQDDVDFIVKKAAQALRAEVGIAPSFAAQGVDEAVFIGRLDELAMGAFRDQCAPADSRMPMLADMKDLMVAAFYGTSIEQARNRVAEPTMGLKRVGNTPDTLSLY